MSAEEIASSAATEKEVDIECKRWSQGHKLDHINSMAAQVGTKRYTSSDNPRCMHAYLHARVQRAFLFQGAAWASAGLVSPERVCWHV